MILQLGKKSICTEVKFFFQPKISLFGAKQKAVIFAFDGFHVCERVRLWLPEQRPNRKACFVIGDSKPFGIQEQKYSCEQKCNCQHNKQGTLVFCFGESFQSQKKDAHHQSDPRKDGKRFGGFHDTMLNGCRFSRFEMSHREIPF